MGKNMIGDGDGVLRRVPPAGCTAMTIVDGVAEVTDTDPLSLRPLGEVIDPDALEAFSGGQRGEPPTTGYVTFEYAGCVVLVDHDDRVMVVPRFDSGVESQPRGDVQEYG
ncbi:HalOD1 output domain-containing protein [Natrialbaceae archaeon A-gly3]